MFESIFSRDVGSSLALIIIVGKRI